MSQLSSVLDRPCHRDDEDRFSSGRGFAAVPDAPPVTLAVTGSALSPGNRVDLCRLHSGARIRLAADVQIAFLGLIGFGNASVVGV